MNFSAQYQCLFVHIPKGAGTSIKEALELPGRGHPPWQYFAQTYPQQWRDYTTFTVVRNPWNRAVSAYTYAQQEKSYWHNNRVGSHPDYETLKGKSFLHCLRLLRDKRHLLQHESWHPQWGWVTEEIGGHRRIVVDNVLRYENLDADFAQLCQILCINPIPLPKVNVTGHKPWQKYYNSKSKALVASLYADDIALFDYEF